jgi:hypothetical protein
MPVETPRPSVFRGGLSLAQAQTQRRKSILQSLSSLMLPQTAWVELRDKERIPLQACLQLLLSLAPLSRRSAKVEALVEPCISSPPTVLGPIQVRYQPFLVPSSNSHHQLTQVIIAIVDPTGTGAFASGTKADVTQQVPGVFGEIAPSGQRRWISHVLVKMGLMKRALNVNRDYVQNPFPFTSSSSLSK